MTALQIAKSVAVAAATIAVLLGSVGLLLAGLVAVFTKSTSELENLNG